MSGAGPWRAGLYMRLSKDDEAKAESASIGTQRQILKSFAESSGIEALEEYVDDGYSGTSFQRPAFQQMMEDIRSGRINCVISKDLSRLGRNSARGCDLLDEIFPALGVRYISVLDGYDSLNLSGGLAMAAPLMMTMHEMYARDISCKIRASLQAKMARGEYIGSFAPYGYRKDGENKNHLLPDPPAAGVVQEIFRRAAQGQSPGEIARELNEGCVATPAAYRSRGRLYRSAQEQERWNSSMLCRLLSQRVYLGHTVQGKTSKLSYKSKATKANPPERWLTIKNTHEPLVSQDCFQAAARRSPPRRPPLSEGFQNIFSGLIFCQDCGRVMSSAPSRKKGVSRKLCCGGYKAGGTKCCSNHFIDYEPLCQAVLEELKIELFLSPQEERELLERLEKPSAPQRRQEAAVKARREELERICRCLYEDRALGRLNVEEYERLHATYQAELRQLKQADSAPKPRPRPEHILPEQLDRGVLQAFIERIEVQQGEYSPKAGKSQGLIIRWRF